MSATELADQLYEPLLTAAAALRSSLIDQHAELCTTG
jgi:hypothetical protein